MIIIIGFSVISAVCHIFIFKVLTATYMLIIVHSRRAYYITYFLFHKRFIRGEGEEERGKRGERGREGGEESGRERKGRELEKG
jgi:hypothetical protein